MKITLLFIVSFCLLSQDLVAIAILIKDPKAYQFLIAEKENRKKIFHRGTSIKIDYGNIDNPNRLRGVITNITADSVTINNYKRKKIFTQTIAIKDINKITKVKQKLKKGLLTIGIITLLLGGGLLVLFNNAPTSAAYLQVVLYLFGVSALYMIFIGLLLVYLPEFLGGQSIKKGWKFKAV
jgi:hypothetical protein